MKVSSSTFLKSLGATFLISFIINSIYYTITADANELDFTRDEPDFLLLTLNHILFALILAYMYQFGFEDKGYLMEGARYGGIMGTLAFLPGALVVRGAWDVPTDGMFVLNTIIAVIVGIVSGIAISYFHEQELGFEDPAPS